jgi:hypothetical protein
MGGIKIDVAHFLGGLDGDVSVSRVLVIPDDAQVRDYSDGSGQLVRRDYTVVEWGHDGIQCVDVWVTKDGCIEVYAEEDDEDEVFMAVYTSPHASLRLDTLEMPEALREAFIATVTERMDFRD